ncbi:alanine racemase C-terminal domain-containing protein [Acinetobacter pittii]|uniref:alanine racemase C-terminal domain-containing protein n=1 Tax=Acinetobacter pittii TaxID=48296 RepID=UPI003891D368
METKIFFDTYSFRSNCKRMLNKFNFIPILRSSNFGISYHKVIDALGINRSYLVDGFKIAEYLRKKGCESKIILTEKYIEEENLKLMNKYKIDLIVDSYSVLNKFIIINQQLDLSGVKIYLKLKDNFSQSGFDIDNIDSLIKMIRNNGYFDKINFVFDFFNLSDHGNIYNINTERFKIISKKISNLKGDFYIMNDYAFFEFCKEGIMVDYSDMYGLCGNINYKNVITFKSFLGRIREFSFFGKRIRVGLVDIGFKSGYLRNSKSNVPILINGMKVKVIGTIKSNYILINLNDFDNLEIGNEVIFWGQAFNGKVLSIHEVSTYATNTMRKMVDISFKSIPKQIEFTDLKIIS